MRRTASLPRSICSFNTDDGIRKATIPRTCTSTTSTITGFNTDNGIRRATIVLKRYPKANAYGVFQYRQRYQEGYN